MKVGKIITEEQTLDISGATLLSAEEAEKYNNRIKRINYAWWLRSPGTHGKYAACVFGESGYVYDNGDFVSGTLGVRPALIVNLKSSNFEIGDRFDFANYTWTIISGEYALCDDIVGECVFREDWKEKGANVYEASDVKKYGDDWFEGSIESEE